MSQQWTSVDEHLYRQTAQRETEILAILTARRYA